MDQHFIESIINNFTIGKVQSFSKIEKGFSSVNYKIVTDKGFFFLKKHRPKGLKNISLIELSEQFFAQNGIPVPAPIKTKEGFLHVISENECYVLYPFVEGEQYPLGGAPTSILMNMGEMLAKVHLLTQKSLPKEFNGFVAENYELPVSESILVRIEELLLKIKGNDSFDSLARPALEAKQKLIQDSLLKPWPEPGRSSHLCLGDYYPDNILFDTSGNIKYMFDLDMAGPAPRMAEVVRSLMLSCFWYQFDADRIEKGNAFLKAYHAHYPFSEEELQKELEIYYIKECHSIWREKRHYLENSTSADSMFEISISALEYLTQHRKYLGEQLCMGIQFSKDI